MAYNVNVNGTWHPAKKVSANVGGTWVDAKQAWVNVNGVWQSVYQSSFAPFNLVTSSTGSNEYLNPLFRYNGNYSYDTSSSFSWKVGAKTLKIYGSGNYCWQFCCWQAGDNGGILPKPNAYYYIRIYNSSYHQYWHFGYTNNGVLLLAKDAANLTNLVTSSTESSNNYWKAKIHLDNNISTDTSSALYPRLFWQNYSSSFNESSCYCDQLYCQEITQSDHDTKTFAELDAMYPWY